MVFLSLLFLFLLVYYRGSCTTGVAATFQELCEAGAPSLGA